MARVAIYARVSSDKQRDAHSVESQLHALRSYAKTSGWAVAGEYIDDGRSAKTGKLEKREAFARLLVDAHAKTFEILLVADVDRLTRTNDFQERAQILGPFQQLGIDIVTPTGGRHDMRSMLGEMYVTFRAMFAAEENRAKSERITRGIERAIVAGRKPKGRTPFGLAYDRKTGAWSIDKPAAAVVRQVFRWILAGRSCQRIAEDLHEAGAVAPPRGWNRNKIWMLATSRHVAGEWIAHEAKRLVIRVPELVDEQTWRAAQAKLSAGGKRGLRRTKNVYLLEELGTCARCGSPVHIRTDKNRAYTKYMCRARKSDTIGGKPCDAPALQVDEVDARVWATVRGVLDDPKLGADLQKRIDARRAKPGPDVSAIRAKLDRLTKSEQGILARYRNGMISDEALDVELAAIRADRGKLETQLEVASDETPAPAIDARAWLAELRELAATNSPETRRRIVRIVIAPGGVVFDGARVRLTLRLQSARLVLRSATRSQHETAMEIRAVA